MTTGLTVENVYLLLTLKLLGGSEVGQASCIETGRIMTAKMSTRTQVRESQSEKARESKREQEREKES